MKKYFLSIVALAAMLFATSCQESLVEPQMEGTTTFTVQLPNEMGTKAIGGHDLVNKLYVEVYAQGATGNVIFETTADKKQDGSFEVSMNLIQDQHYSIIFWAQQEGAYVVENLRSIPMNVNHPNNESGAAFYAYLGDFVPSGTSQTVTLKRPFAQLNLGTTEGSLITDAGEFELSQSEISVKGVAESFNTVLGYGEGSKDVYFELKNVPAEILKVADNEYKYISMNYLPVAGDNKALVEVKAKATVKDEQNNTQDIYHVFTSVPIQENYRTNIVGNLISSSTDFNVVVDDKFDGELPSTEEEKLQMVAQVGGEFTLTEDIVLTQPLEVTGNMVIKMNGKTISGNWHKNDGAIIKNNGNLKLVGGSIESLGENGGSAVQNNGIMTIDDVTLNGARNANGSWPSYTVNNTGELTINNSNITSYHGSVASYGDNAIVIMNNTNIHMTGIPGFTSHGIYTYNNGKVTVNGGSIANKATDQAASGASVINGSVTVNAGEFTGRIENYYGTPVLKGGNYSINPNQNFIADGYKVIEKDGRYYVVEEGVDAVAGNTGELQTSLNNGEDVVLTDDIAVESNETGSNGYGATGISQLNGGVIDGNGNAISVDAWGTWDSAINTTGGTIKNLNVTGGMRGIFVNHNSTTYSGKVVLENVTIDGTIYTISCDQGTNKGLEAYNSTFNGWTSYAATIGNVKFDSCSFGAGQGYSFCRPYAPTEFVNCAFEAGYELDARAAVTFENCTIGGVALTAENLATLVTGGIANATIK